jgi:hypothetical protein
MLIIGLICFCAGIFLTAFNRRLVRTMFGRELVSDSFHRSISRQNTAIVGITLLFFGMALVVMYSG